MKCRPMKAAAILCAGPCAASAPFSGASTGLLQSIIYRPSNVMVIFAPQPYLDLDLQEQVPTQCPPHKAHLELSYIGQDHFLLYHLI